MFLLFISLAFGDSGSKTPHPNSSEALFNAAREMILSPNPEMEEEGIARLYERVKGSTGLLAGFTSLSDTEKKELLDEITEEASEEVKNNLITTDIQLFDFSRSRVKEEVPDSEPPVANKNQSEFEEQFLKIKKGINDSNPQTVQDSYTELFNLIKKQIHWQLQGVPESKRDDVLQEVAMRVFKRVKEGRVESGRHLFHLSRLIARGRAQLYFAPISGDGKIEKNVVDIESLLYFLREKGSGSPLVKAQNNELIEKALQALTPRQRKMVTLYFLDEKTESEIALLVGTGDKNVDTILLRSLKIMRETMEQLGLQTSQDINSDYVKEVEKDYGSWLEKNGFRPRPRRSGGVSSEETSLNSRVERARLYPGFGRGLSEKAKKILNDIKTEGARKVANEINRYVEEHHILPSTGTQAMKDFDRFYENNSAFKENLSDESRTLLYVPGANRTAKTRWFVITKINSAAAEDQLPPSENKAMRHYRANFKNDPAVIENLSEKAQKLLNERVQRCTKILTNTHTQF